MSAWTRAQLEALPTATISRLPRIELSDVIPIADGIDIWDSWPIRTPDGSIADVCGHEVWVALAAPADADPALRHDLAELRAFILGEDRGFVDLGPLFAPGEPLGSRQWAGSTVLDGDEITVFYTAAGVGGAVPPGFRQRPAATTGTLECGTGLPSVSGWSTHRQILEPNPEWYDSADAVDGQPGYIKAFRDPFSFIDPVTGKQVLLLTASLSRERSRSEFNGAVGIAIRSDSEDTWELLEPLITAEGVNNELERPHFVVHDDLYYLFFSTQARTFHPEVTAPTGLYGFVASSLLGPYEPLNGHGLVFANPPERPLQAYSWTVLNDLRVVGFVDAVGIDGATGTNMFDDPGDRRRGEFGGTLSPRVRLTIRGSQAAIANLREVPGSAVVQ